ncbi:MAG TPA: hypothetical protein ENN28_02610 [Candidatus Uhrbacteria bacterium]|nr:hypothetical protein [Candidatus Uhrbacteria bacterium]
MEQVKKAAREAVKSGSGNRTGFTLRENLLQNILHSIEQAKLEANFSEALEAALWSNADLRQIILANRANCLIAKRQILSSLPRQGNRIVKKFIDELLISGNRSC